MGFPLVEAEPDGSFVVTKHPNTGGLVSVHTVSEQILYEIGSPGYLTPDVVARFDSMQLTQEGPDRVRVTGARGEPAPEKLKVSISFQNGWRAFGRLIVSGPGHAGEGQQSGGRVLGKRRRPRASTTRRSISSSAGMRVIRRWRRSEPGEVMLQFAVRDQDERKINTRFAPQLVPRVLATVPGISYIADQGRPRASEVIAFWPALVSRAAVKQRVVIGDEEIADRGSSIVHRRSSIGQASRASVTRSLTSTDHRSPDRRSTITLPHRPRPSAETLPCAVRRQGRHREHRRDRAVRGHLRVDDRSSDRRVRRAVFRRSLQRRGGALPAAQSSGDEFPASSKPGRRRHALAAPGRAGENLRAVPCSPRKWKFPKG